MDSLIVIPMATVRMPEFLMQFVRARSGILIIGGPGTFTDARYSFYLSALQAIRGRTRHTEAALGMGACFEACKQAISGDPLLLWTEDDIWLADLLRWEDDQREGIGYRVTFSGGILTQDAHTHFGLVKVRASNLFAAIDQGNVDFSVPFWDRTLLQRLQLPHLPDVGYHLTHPTLGSHYQDVYDQEGGNILWDTP